MSKATRIGDGTSGICDPGVCEACPHSREGNNISGSDNVFINGKRVHRRGDVGSCNCPHGGSYQSTGASATVFANGRGITRIGDVTTCQNCGCAGNHVSGSDNVFVGD